MHYDNSRMGQRPQPLNATHAEHRAEDAAAHVEAASAAKREWLAQGGPLGDLTRLVTATERRLSLAEVLAILRAQKAMILTGQNSPAEVRQGALLATDDLIRIFANLE